MDATVFIRPADQCHTLHKTQRFNGSVIPAATCSPATTTSLPHRCLDLVGIDGAHQTHLDLMFAACTYPLVWLLCEGSTCTHVRHGDTTHP